MTLPGIKSLLRICSFRSYEQAQRVYTLGDTSDELLILLSGRLSIRGEAGAPFGEMGFFTEPPRSATVIAMEAANGLRISKEHLFRILQTNEEMHYIANQRGNAFKDPAESALPAQPTARRG